MNLKKLVAISDHFPNCASSRKKVVSGFGLGFVSFFIFLFVLFWKFSFKNPTPNQLFFQEFNSSSSSSSSRRSIFVENATTILTSENIVESNGSNISLEFLDFDGKNGSFDGNLEKSVDFDDTHLIKLKDDVKNASLNGILEKSVDLEDTHLIKLKDDVKNGSFNGILEKSVDFDDTHLVEFKDDVKNGSFNGILEKNVDFNDTHLVEFKDDVKNASFNGILKKGIDLEDTHLIKLKDDVKNASFSAILVNPNEGKVGIGEKSGNGSVKSDGLDLNLDGVSNKRGFADKDDATISQNLGNFGKDCDIFDGRWVRDDTKPYYPLGSCPYIDRDLNCHLNGRPDDEFVKWRWQPFGCEIPSLNAADFLERLRGKKLVFVGDSLNRNMWESLVCILQHSIKNKKRVYEISGKREFKKKGVYAFRFEDYNCTIDFVWSPFLVRESSFKGKNGTFETLRLDLMDRATSMYRDADVLIFNTGHWWTHEKTSRGEDYYQEGNHVHPRLKALDAYTRALSTWARWVDKNIDSQKTQVIFRGYSVTHFRGGQWNSGGQCHKETEPIFNTTQLTKYPSKMRAFDNVMRAMKTPIIYLNISRLTDYRKDGHPSVYRKMYKSMTLEQQIGAEQSQDCSHWCLPGVPDTWNELLYASLLKIGRGSWKS